MCLCKQSVQGCVCESSLCKGLSVQAGSVCASCLCKGVSVQGSVCASCLCKGLSVQGSVCARVFLCKGVSVKAVCARVCPRKQLAYAQSRATTAIVRKTWAWFAAGSMHQQQHRSLQDGCCMCSPTPASVGERKEENPCQSQAMHGLGLRTVHAALQASIL